MLRKVRPAALVSALFLCLMFGSAIATSAQQFAVAPDPSAGIQYVAKTCGGGVSCSDMNSGLSWGSAKATPQAAITALPSTGGTIHIAQGTYTGPASFRNNVRIECMEYQAPSVVLNAADGFWQQVSDQKCIFTYSTTLVLDSLQSLYIKGIAFQCPSGGSSDCVDLKGVTNSKFTDDSFYSGTGTAAANGILILGAGTTQTHQSAGNVFEDIFIAGYGNGIALQGAANQSNVVTLNFFDNIFIFAGSNGYAIAVQQGADTNSFRNVFISTSSSTEKAIVLNQSQTPGTDVDADNNYFSNITFSNSAGSVPVWIGESKGNVIQDLNGNWGNNPPVGNLGGSPVYELTVGADFGEGKYNYSHVGSLTVNGNLSVTGTKSAVVDLSDGRSAKLYALESPENWFEDFGAARLRNGQAFVRLRKDFLATVDAKAGYHVFITPKGPCDGLYVAKENDLGFDVRVIGDRQCSITFDYRIVARRRGFEKLRMGRK